MPPHWEHFEHEADIGVRGFGTTPGQAFEQAALALCAVITDPTAVAIRDQVRLNCNNTDHELLLADWLNELVYAITTRKMLFSRFDVQIDGSHLNATAWGEPIDVQRHQPAVEVKGATYTELAVREAQGEWVAQCVVDV